MALAQETIGITWFEGTRRWQVFGLLPDHRIYGECTDLGTRDGFRTMEGTVSPADHQRIVSLVEQIRKLPPRTESEAGDAIPSGFLYEGSRNNPHILFRRYANEPSPIHDELFAEIVEILGKHCPPAVGG